MSPKFISHSILFLVYYLKIDNDMALFTSICIAIWNSWRKINRNW